MSTNGSGYLSKLAWSMPWLVRYPFWRAEEVIRRITDNSGPQHLIILVANHFEPAWKDKNEPVDLATQQRRLDDWIVQAERIGRAVRDQDDRPFCHTYFFPGDEYFPVLLDTLAAHQGDGFGEVEVHLHHGVERPDTPANLRSVLVEFRDALVERHKCLSRIDGVGPAKYGFVHGNLALANSAGGRLCGVDEEMQILAETGCYADFTLPAAPNQSQVPRINAIYQCGNPLTQRKPHRSGPGIRVGKKPEFPIIFTGPLVFNWRRRIKGLPVPRLDDGALAVNYVPDFDRLNDWRGAHIGVAGRPDWIFVKLFCHGFFPEDQPAMIGDEALRFWSSAVEMSQKTGRFHIHFATARQAVNMVLAAADGHDGNPGSFRDYRLVQIMDSQFPKNVGADREQLSSAS